MNKKILATAVSVALFAAAGSAQAVDLVADTGTATFATENDTSGGLTIDNTGGSLNISSAFGFSIGTGTSKYIRLEISGAGATFNGAFVDSVASGDSVTAAGEFDDDTGAANNAYTISQDGQAGDSVVIVEVTAAADIAQDDVWTANMADMDITGEGTVTATYTLHETAVDAVNDTNALETQTGSVLDFADGHNFATDTSNSSDFIDVSNSSLSFVTGNLTVDLGEVDLTNVAGNQFIADGVEDYTIAGNQTNGELVITGDFTAAGNVFLDVAGGDCNAVGMAADTITDTTATFNNVIGTADDVAAVSVCYTVDGSTAIPESSYTATYTPTNAAGYDATATSNQALLTLAKNTSSDRVNFLTPPGGSFTSYVMVKNPSSQAGVVYFNLTNNAGDTVQVDLGDVTGGSDSLAAGGNTGLITVSSIYDAVVAADATFNHNSAQLSLVVDAEFGDTSANSGVVVNAFVVNADGSASMINDGRSPRSPQTSN
jgi:hypothetical protein